MTLFGSLKTSFTGLTAQGTKMGAISDNIANVSTVGYKRTDVQFSTLVTERIGKTRFNPGGVTARPLQTVDVRGNIQGSARSTHIAVEGDGMFTVSEEGTFGITRETIRYTRSGAFRPDDDGYLRNSALYYLQGYPTNRDGTPARDGVDFDSLDQNFSDLEPVDINRISSLAEETDNVRIRATLPAEATTQITLRDGDSTGAAGAASLTKADVVAGIAAASKADYTSTVQVYDAQGTPRKVTLEWYKLGDSTTNGGATQSDSTPNEWAVHIDARTGMEGLQNSNLGYKVTVAANTSLAGGPATIPAFEGTISEFVNQLNGTAAGGNGLNAGERFVVTNNGYNANNDLYQIQVERRDANGNLVGATEYLRFSPTAADASTATTAAAVGTNLAGGAAIANITYDPPTDSEVGLVSFIGDFDEGSEGNDLITAGGFATQTLFVKFNGDGSLRNVWDDVVKMRADVLNTDNNGIDDQAIGSRESEAGNTPRQFGIAAYTASNAGRVGESGSAIDNDPATAAGISNFITDFKLKTTGEATDTVQPQQTRSPFKEQGSQPLFFELFMGRGTTLGDKLVGKTGTNDTFDGTGLDGINSLNSGGAEPFLETLFLQQDGIRAGIVTGVTVDGGGLVTAIYDNGMTRPIYQLGLAKFANYNGLINESGNVYQESEESGDVLLVKPGRSGVGEIRGSALEQANVDLGSEFTDMIITQQAFTANTRSITTTDEMLTDINNLVR